MNKELVNLLQSLIRISSENPPGDETKIVLFMKNYLKSINVEYKIYEFKKNRPNLVCIIKSKNSKKRLLLTPHIDTVPATGKWKFAPFSGKIYKDRIYGRGATDCKVNVAICLYLIKKLIKENNILKNIDLVFAFSSDEETGSRYGIIPLLKFLKNIDYGIVLDSDDFDIIVAQKGLLHLRIELFGKEAHGAYPERGINAIEYGIKILNELINRPFKFKRHKLLNKPTLNIGRFVGGDKVNIVAGYCFFELDIRLVPSMDKEYIIKDIVDIIKKYPVKYKIKILAYQDPIEIDENNFLITILKNVLKRQKIKPNITSSFGATVLTFLIEKNISAFSFGFGSKGQAHSKNEFVKIDNLLKGAVVLEEYIKELDKFFK